MTATQDGRPERSELRIALAMRGGVSLAVWIGGAVAEIDLMRRAFDPEPDPAPRSNTVEGAAELRRKHYGDLLREAGYNAVKVDVLAGASAGGLNAVIYGVAQSAGLASLDWLRDVWADRGELWKLMHEHWKLQDTYGVPGVLRGDDYFYTSILEELRKELPDLGSPAREPTDYLTVDLAATLADGPDLQRPESLGGAATVARSREAAFHFRHTPARPGRHNDFPESKDDDEQLRRVAYAARATSSFPGAFEPARIRSGGGAGRGGDLPGNMAAVFSEAGPGTDAEFRVVDGGVFDNIPIARALAAVVDSPASTRADRYLVYLDPSPPVAGSEHVEAERSTSPGSDFFSRTVLHALLMKVRAEEASDELAQIRVYNSETRLQLRRQLSACAELGVVLPPGDWETRYAGARADLDCDRVLALATRPGLGLLRSAAPPLVAGRAITEDDALTRRAQLHEEMAVRPGAELARDARALAWLATSLIASVRDLEDDDPASTVVQALGPLKKDLYLIRAAALLVADLRDRAELIQLLGGELASGFDVTAAADAIGDPNAESFWAALSEEVATDPDCDPLWQKLAEVATNPQLQTTLPPWGRASVEDLQIYGAVLVTRIGVPTAGKAIKFERITGDEPSAGAPDRVKDRAVRDTVRIALSGKRVTKASVRSVASRPLLRAETKLSGGELANFSGFLDRRWRLGDWQWGRADAFSALTRMLKREADGPANGATDDRSPPDATNLLDKIAPKQRFGDLSPAYRYALVAWLVQLLLRAVWPLRAGRAPTARNLVRAFALMAVRPVAIFVPLLARPLALAMLVGTVVASQRFESEPPVGDLGLQVPIGLLLAWVGFLLGRCAGLARRWNLVGEAWPAPDSDTVHGWAGMRKKHLLHLQVLLVVAVVLGIVALIWLSTVDKEFIPTLLPLEVVTIAIAVIALGEVALGRLRRPPGATSGSRDFLMVAGLLLPVVLYLTNFLAGPTLDRWPWASTAVVALAAAVSASLVHHAWAEDTTAVSTGLFVGGVAYGALALRQEWSFVRDLDPRLGAVVALLSVPLVFVGIVLARHVPPRSWLVALVLSTVLATAGVVGALAVWPHQPVPHALLIAGAVSAATTLFVPRRTEAPAA